MYSGEIPRWDTTRVRPAGERLKTFGGRASGPGPLEELFRFTVDKFRDAVGRKLTSIECHDIMCKIGEIVVVGGVRRSAMISLSNVSDDRMRNAKNGKWWEYEGQRALANNSACYTETPDVGVFLDEWKSLYDSKSGERGIFNRKSSANTAFKSGRRKVEGIEFGTNPCSEIILRPYQFCNLTEVVVRADDTLETLLEKVKIATILGTFQSTLTNLPYLRKIWTKNTEEERLLGVSLTGIMDNEVLSGLLGNDELREILRKLKEHAIEINAVFADILGIPQSAAISCVKPSGTVSQLVDSASGIHPRHSAYYIRSVRGDNKDPLTQFLKDSGVYYEPDVMKPDNTTVFFFPIKSPDKAIMREDMTAIDHLELWKVYQEEWCEHKPSITVSVRENEWPEVGGWVYKNFDIISGISFLPYSDHSYRQAPYEECSKEYYNEMKDRLPINLDWSRLSDYEKEDNTIGMQTYACSGDSCEIVDIT